VARGTVAGDLTTDNADVPGTYADGGKIKVWITPLATGNAWGTNTETNDTLNKSIVGGTGAGPYVPSYIHSTNMYSNTNNETEHYMNEATVLHAYGYTKTFASEAALETLMEGAYDYAQTIWG